MACCGILTDHSKLIVQSDQKFTSVKENQKEKEKKSENRIVGAKETAGRQGKYSRPVVAHLNFMAM